MTQKERSQKFYNNRKNNGLCIRCGGKSRKGKIMCSDCAEQQRIYRKETRDFFKKLGICPRCGKNKLFGDEKRCPECSIRENKYIINRDRERTNEYRRVWGRNDYQQKKKEGICTRCGKRKADSGYFTCSICREKIRQWKRIKYGKPIRSERYKQGLCYFCDNPVEDGYKVCKEHHQINIENARSKGANMARKELLKEKILY